MGLYFMLIAGGGTGNKRDEDGAFVFDTSELPTKTRWSTGSARCWWMFIRKLYSLQWYLCV